MKTGTTLATAVFALASLPLLAQQPSPANQPNSPATQPATQQNPPSAAPAASPAASPETATVEMSPVNGELVSKLDSKTAKTGDNVVVKTETSIKTADGTEIPKGSRLIGHIIAVQPSGAGTNSQVALQFDHVELKGGQSVPVHS
jgi:biotin carboxyl carrier protein